MKNIYELQYLSIGLFLGGIISVVFGGIAGGFAILMYALGGMVRDRQHTGRWFP